MKALLPIGSETIGRTDSSNPVRADSISFSFAPTSTSDRPDRRLLPGLEAGIGQQPVRADAQLESIGHAHPEQRERQRQFVQHRSVLPLRFERPAGFDLPDAAADDAGAVAEAGAVGRDVADG